MGQVSHIPNQNVDACRVRRFSTSNGPSRRQVGRLLVGKINTRLMEIERAATHGSVNSRQRQIQQQLQVCVGTVGGVSELSTQKLETIKRQRRRIQIFASCVKSQKLRQNLLCLCATLPRLLHQGAVFVQVQCLLKKKKQKKQQKNWQRQQVR